MARQLFENNAATTLAAALSIGGTSMSVASGAGSQFPNPTGGDYFLLTLFEHDVGGNEVFVEVVKCTARSGDNLTIVRDIEGIVGVAGGRAYPSAPLEDVFIELRWTQMGADNMLQAVANLSDLANAGISRTNLGIGNVDNTSDVNKPVSTAQQTALNLKANLASPTFTGTVSGITKTMVGLSAVDNTSDTGKPVSTAQQTALDLKVNRKFTAKSGGYTAVAGDRLMCDTSGAPFTVTLPITPAVGDTVEVTDAAGTFSTNALTIGRNGSKIRSLTEDMTINTNNAALGLVYTGATNGWGFF